MDIPYIIVAGGKGLRMGSSIPKQYIEIDDKPIIFYTVSNLVNAGIKKFIIVMDFSYKDYLEKFLKPLNVDIKYVQGGKERFDSVRNGINAIDYKTEYVAIHDSVRPFVNKDLLDRLNHSLDSNHWSCVIPVLKCKDTMKSIFKGHVESTLKRDSLRRVGTPQIVRLKDYQIALEKIGSRILEATDDASIMEMVGYTVGIVEGDEMSFKITDEYDLEYFRCLLRRGK